MSMSARAVGAIASGAAAAVIGLATVGVTDSYHTVTVRFDDLDKVVSGFYPDVASALEAAEVELAEYDTVTPAPQETLQEGQLVEVARAQPFVVHTAEGTDTAWSAAASLDKVLDDLSEQTVVRKVTPARGEDDPGLALTAQPAQLTVTVDGDSQQVQVSGGESLDEVLETAGVTPEPLDSVFLVSTAQGLNIDVTTEQREIIVTQKKISHKTKRVDDPDELEGTETVTQEGRDGRRTILTYERLVGGEVTLSRELSNTVTRKPKTQIISVGTKEPEPEPSLAASTGSGTDVSGVEITGADAWAALAQCESGGNPSTNTGNGYYGMYQFSLSTWRSVGGTGLPSDASADEQTRRAQILQQRSGWGQWPACSARLGLR